MIQWLKTREVFTHAPNTCDRDLELLRHGGLCSSGNWGQNVWNRVWVLTCYAGLRGNVI